MTTPQNAIFFPAVLKMFFVFFGFIILKNIGHILLPFDSPVLHNVSIQEEKYATINAEVIALRARVNQLRSTLGELSCSCKGIGPTGGFCLLPPVSGARYDGGTLAGGGVGGNAILSLGLATALGELTKGHGVHNFGAGMGHYDLFWDAARAKGQAAPARSTACDGAENIETVAPLGSDGTPRVKFCDLTEPMELEAEDWVISLEVGEHIPQNTSSSFLDLLHKHNRKGIIISWAIRGQGGHGHINEKNNDEVIKMITEIGYYQNEWTRQFQSSVRRIAHYSWFRNTFLVFLKKIT